VPAVRASLGALQERQFRLLWLGQTSSAVGDSLVPVALAFAVLGLSGSARDLGLVLGVNTLARAALTLAGGVWADRLPRRAVMLAADVVRAATELFVAAIILTGSAELWMFLVSAAVLGAAAAFFSPASTGLVPQVVSPERLQQANALISISRGSISIFGPAVSGLLVAGVGAGWVFAIDSITFVGSAAFLLAMRVPTRARPQRQSFVRDLAEGWREVRSRTWLSAGLVCFSISNLSVAAYFVLGPLVVEEELSGARDWGIALTGGAVGGIVGSALALRFRPRHPLRWSFLVILPITLQLLALIPPVPAAGLFFTAVLAVAAIALSNVLWNTTLQERIPEHALSRVSAYDWMVSLVFMPIGYAVAGPLAEAIGVDETLALAAGICLVANLSVLLVPDVRNLRRLGDEESEAMAGPVALSPAEPA
jgi:MFS family permease